MIIYVINVVRKKVLEETRNFSLNKCLHRNEKLVTNNYKLRIYIHRETRAELPALNNYLTNT